MDNTEDKNQVEYNDWLNQLSLEFSLLKDNSEKLSDDEYNDRLNKLSSAFSSLHH